MTSAVLDGTPLALCDVEEGFMRNRTPGRFVGITFAVLTLLPLAGGRAQETANEVTREEWRCQTAFGRSVTDLGLATADCLAECWSRPSSGCSVSFADVATRDCLDRALAAAEARTVDACAGSACPECYDPNSFDGCRNHTRSVFNEARSFTDSAVGLLYCNDAGSPDGLTRPEAQCQSGLLRTGGRFTEAAARCFAKCNKQARKGRIEVEACDSAALDTPGLDPGTQACVDRARARLLSGCEALCSDPPDCFTLSCSTVLFGATQQLTDLAPQVFCEDVPPPRCGDEAVNGIEQCDSSASPNGCEAGETCFDCRFCSPVCGDGIRSPSEQCDASVAPDGCPPGFECAPFGCFCRQSCGNGEIDPGEECEPFGFGGQTCANGEVCTSGCTCEAIESVVEDLTPCSARDTWEFRATAGQTVDIRADTVDQETATDLVFGGGCSNDAGTFSRMFLGDDEAWCSFGLSRCPATTFSVPSDVTCEVTVSVFGFSPSCTNPATAGYRLDVSGTGLTLVADDSPSGAFL
jgi:hypothetical protein